MFGLGILTTIIVGGITVVAAALKISKDGQVTDHDRTRANDDLV